MSIYIIRVYNISKFDIIIKNTRIYVYYVLYIYTYGTMSAVVRDEGRDPKGISHCLTFYPAADAPAQ